MADAVFAAKTTRLLSRATLVETMSFRPSVCV
jgi:hypothetical protein